MCEPTFWLINFIKFCIPMQRWEVDFVVHWNKCSSCSILRRKKFGKTRRLSLHRMHFRDLIIYASVPNFIFNVPFILTYEILFQFLSSIVIICSEFEQIGSFNLIINWNMFICSKLNIQCSLCSNFECLFPILKFCPISDVQM